ncbi:hypothetical protein CDFC105_31370 [Clostridioides difficile]|nr:hypothetical protein CDFC105_31370 [Clostridioides difficile]
MCGFFFQAEDGIRDAQESRGLGDVYKRQDIDEELRDKVKGFIIAKKEDADYREGLEIADILCNPLSLSLIHI